MAKQVVMPQMGESVAEGTIVRWLKKVGDAVERDEPLFEISTDKVDAEIPSPAAGVLSDVRVKEGETVPINTVVGVIDETAAKPAAAPAKTAASAPATCCTQRTRGTFRTRCTRLRPQGDGDSSGRFGPYAPVVPSAPDPRRVRTVKHPVHLLHPPHGGAASTRRYGAPPLPRLARPWSAAEARELRLSPSCERSRASITSTCAILLAVARAAASRRATSSRTSTRALRRLRLPHRLRARRYGGRPPPRKALRRTGRPRRRRYGGQARLPFIGAKSVGDGWARRRQVRAHADERDAQEDRRAHGDEQAHIAARAFGIRDRLHQGRRDPQSQESRVTEKAGGKLTYMSFITKACAEALKKVPIVNASVDGADIIFKKDVNIGVAVALDWGLIVPVVKNADKMSLLRSARRSPTWRHGPARRS